MKELPEIPITDLIDAFGTKTKIGEAIGVTHSAICHWGDFVPATRLHQMHYLLNQINLIEQSGTDI